MAPTDAAAAGINTKRNRRSPEATTPPTNPPNKPNRASQNTRPRGSALRAAASVSLAGDKLSTAPHLPNLGKQPAGTLVA